MIKVPNYDILVSLPSKPEENEVALCEKEEMMYKYLDGVWTPMDKDSTLELSLYDVNKQIVTQLPPIEKTARATIKETINSYVRDSSNQFYMLLCKDLSYYTLFHRAVSHTEPLSEVLFICLDNIGVVKAIEPTADNNAIEIWITIDDESYVMYFFAYDVGVVACR